MSSTATEPAVIDPQGSLRTQWGFTLDTRRGRSTVQVMGTAVTLAVWEWLAVTEIIPPILMPGPFEIAIAFWNNLISIFTGGYMLEHVITTFSEVAIGFAIAITVGLTLGGVISEFRTVRTMMMPYIIALYATPRIAVAPIFLIWFGFGPESKIMMAAATGVFPVLIGTIAGLAATDRMTTRLMRAYGATRWQIFRKVRIYDALPYIFAGLETGVVLALIGAIVGEFMGGNSGIGYVIVVAQESLNLPLAFASLILLSLFGVLLHRLVLLTRHRTVYWMDHDDDVTSRTML